MVEIILANWKKQLPPLLCIVGLIFIIAGLLQAWMPADQRATLVGIGLGELGVGVILLIYFRSNKVVESKAWPSA